MSECSYLYLSYLFLIQLLSGPGWFRAPCTTNAQRAKRLHQLFSNSVPPTVAEPNMFKNSRTYGGSSVVCVRPANRLSETIFVFSNFVCACACVLCGFFPCASSLCYATLPNFRRLMHMPPASCNTVRSIASPAPCSAGISHVSRKHGLHSSESWCGRTTLHSGFKTLFRSEGRMYVWPCAANILFVFRLVSMG